MRLGFANRHMDASLTLVRFHGHGISPKAYCITIATVACAHGSAFRSGAKLGFASTCSQGMRKP